MRSGTSFKPGLRAAAKASGEPFYFTGKPCVRGHVDQRHTVSGKCATCRKEDNAKYPAAWRVDNRDKHLELCRQWGKKNCERATEYKRMYRKQNPDAFRAQRRDYYARNAARLRSWFRARRAKRRATGSFTPADIDDIRRMQNGRCAYCRCALKYVQEHVDHINPVSRDGTNQRRNLQILCAPCNRSKGAHDPLIYARRLGRLI